MRVPKPAIVIRKPEDVGLLNGCTIWDAHISGGNPPSLVFDVSHPVIPHRVRVILTPNASVTFGTTIGMGFPILILPGFHIQTGDVVLEEERK